MMRLAAIERKTELSACRYHEKTKYNSLQEHQMQKYVCATYVRTNAKSHTLEWWLYANLCRLYTHVYVCMMQCKLMKEIKL